MRVSPLFIELSSEGRGLESAKLHQPSPCRNEPVTHPLFTSRRILALALVLAVAGGCSPPGPEGEAPLAAVDGRAIDGAELEAALKRVRLSGSLKGRLETATPEGRRKVLATLVDEFLFAAEARARGLDEGEEIRRAIERETRRLLAEAYVAAALANLDRSPAALRRFHDAHPDRFSTPKRVLARHIVVAEREQAETLRGEVLAGADFNKLAREHNTDRTRVRGGELGWVAPNLMVPEFEAVIFELAPGGTSPVFETPFGFHVAQVLQVQPAATRPFATIRPRVEEALRNDRIDELRRAGLARFEVRYADDLDALLIHSRPEQR